MIRASWAVSALLLIAAALPAHAASIHAFASDDTCTDRYAGPNSGRVDVTGSGSVTETEIGFKLVPDGNDSDSIQVDTLVFHVDGASGKTDIRSDDSFTAYYKPTKAGSHTVTATWTRIDCRDIGRQTTASGSTPAAPFEVTNGVRPSGATFTKHKRARVKSFHAPGDASVAVLVKCPPDEVATHEELRVDVYWTTGGRPASHASKHVWTRMGKGCWGDVSTRSKPFDSKLLHASGSGQSASIDVFEPLRVDALIEVRSGGAIVVAKRAKFRPSRTGESVRLSSP